MLLENSLIASFFDVLWLTLFGVVFAVLCSKLLVFLSHKANYMKDKTFWFLEVLGGLVAVVALLVIVEDQNTIAFQFWRIVLTFVEGAALTFIVLVGLCFLDNTNNKTKE
jgi:hypothetical protein